MQNRTFLLLFRPIFGEKLKTAPPKGNWVPKLWSRCRDSVWKSVWISDFGRKIRLNFGEDLFFWRPPVFKRKKRLNFRAFREIPFQISDKPCETDSSIMKIRVKVLCTFLTFSKKPPPLFQILAARLMMSPEIGRNSCLRHAIGNYFELSY